jgi:hypothetical protein
MRKGVSTMVQINPVLAMASGNPGRGPEVIVEGRWSIPVGIAFGVDGQPVAAECVLVGVEVSGGVYRYRLKMVDVRKPCDDKDLGVGVASDGSEHPDPERDPDPAG